MNDFDVIVIGAGPAGSIAAHTLAKNGIGCAIIEQRKTPGEPVCCGEAISEFSLRSAGAFHGSYIDKKVEGFRVFFPNLKYFRVPCPGYLINRDKFDKYLFNLAIEKGAKPFLKQRVLNAARTANGFEISTGNKVFTSRFLVGADGPASLVDSVFFRNKPVLAEACQYKLSKEKYKYDSKNHLDFYYDPLSNYYFWIFEKTGEINIGGVVKDKEDLRQFIKKRLNVADFGHTGFCRGYIPVSGVKKSIFSGQAFLSGDAAGLTNPVSLAGIYTALLSGKIAAYCIYGDIKLGKKETPGVYARAIAKQGFSGSRMNYAARHCFSFPEETLNFMGDYFNGRDFTYKNYGEFIKLALKHPIIFKYLFPLINHRQLLKDKINKLW